MIEWEGLRDNVCILLEANHHGSVHVREGPRSNVLTQFGPNHNGSVYVWEGPRDILFTVFEANHKGSVRVRDVSGHNCSHLFELRPSTRSGFERFWDIIAHSVLSYDHQPGEGSRGFGTSFFTLC